MIDLAGLVTCVLTRSTNILLEFDQMCGKVLEHIFFQTIAEEISMREWSSYPAGIEMGLHRNIAKSSIEQNVLLHL
ncbi:hypothetical protein TNCV_429471 [Trichonephila clavipes]|nr:hypothetical protein TNCV_429471 [Trichonephila clavipes]